MNEILSVTGECVSLCTNAAAPAKDAELPFSSIFTREGDMEYTVSGNTEHRGLKDRVLP